MKSRFEANNAGQKITLNNNTVQDNRAGDEKTKSNNDKKNRKNEIKKQNFEADTTVTNNPNRKEENHG